MVSVVIACYNVERYVENAVRSAMNQTLRDVEIICVDDGSKDGTLAIIERLAAEDSRVKVVRHEENQGLLAVRCHGLQAAGGEYMMFLDGDDYLDRRACEEALAVAGEKKADIVQFGATLFETEGVPAEQIHSLNRMTAPCMKSLPKGEGMLVKSCFIDRLFSWNLWGKLIRTEIAKKAFGLYGGERLTMGEDMLGFFMILVFAGSYAPLNKPYYHYRQGSGVTAISPYLPVERMLLFAQEYQVYGLLKQWLERLQVKEKHQQALAFVRQRVDLDMYNAFAHRLDPADSPRAAQMLAQYWPADELAIALNWGLYRENNWKKRAELIGSLRHAGCLQTKPRSVRTVGTFYLRMYNGGIERVISRLAPIWQANGWRVVVFTEEINALDYALPDNVIRVVIPKITACTLDDVEARARAWMDAIREYEIDAMVYHAWVTREMMEDQIAIKSTGIPLIMHTHGLFSTGLGESGVRYQYQAATQREGYALCDVIVTLGKVDCAWWSALGYRTVTTINPSTYDLREVRPAALQGKNVLWVGRISEQKQVFEAFKTMRLVHEKVPDARLQIVGSAETEEMMRQVRDYLSSHEMNGYVSLEGYQSDVTPFYEQAALVLWTAGYEGAPMGMVEAKAFGLPIVCYELANVDMTREPRGMRVVRQKDGAEAARQVVALLEDDALREELGRESRRSVEEMYSIDLGAHWKDILELAMQPREEEKMASELSPMETTARMSMDFLAKGMDYRMRFGGLGGSDEDLDEGQLETMKALEEMYMDGYFVKAYVWINKLFPKGGKARERVKKIASLFFR